MRLVSALKYTLLSIYAVCGVLIIVFLLPQTGWKALSVLTGSMRPAIPQGSLVIIHTVLPAELHPGDVVTYRSLGNVHQTITHRIVTVRVKAGTTYLVTKGDANSGPDPEIVAGRVVGRVTYHVPVLGSLLQLANHPLGVFLLVGLPGLFIIIDEIRLMRRRLRHLAGSGLNAHSAQPHQSSSSTATAPPASHHTIIRAALPLIGVGLLLSTLGVTWSAWSDQATFSANRITSAIPSPSPSPSPGPGSCSHTTNTTAATVINTNHQAATTGSASAAGTTQTGPVTSGNASNSNNTATSITVINSCAP